MAKGKLELTWVGKENRPRLEPRVLVEDPAKSYGDPAAENILIHGDNLLALKALEQDFAGKIKCIYIDPPYNTGNAFEHYDDGVEHSIWLGFMRDRLEVLRSLLRSDGFICCHIDDSEGHYLKPLMDEIFGRSNYLTTVYVQVRYADKTLKQDMAFHKQVEQMHVYRKEFGAVPVLNQIDNSFEKFRFYVTELGPGTTKNIGGRQVQVFSPTEYRISEREGSGDGLKEIWATGTILDGNSSGRFFRDYIVGRVSEDGLGALYKVPGIGDDKFGFRYFTGPRRENATKGKYFQGVPRDLLDNPSAAREAPIENFLDLAGSFGNCRHEGGVEFRSGKKPEKLIQFVLMHFSNMGDFVLDSFAGSGTTGAVAHKMGRRWIMAEFGEHCHTHIIPRLKKAIDGADPGGVTEATGWKGGGGFKYYRLAESLLVRDRELSGKHTPIWIINPKYDEKLLIRSICKIENFHYRNNGRLHGVSSESRFLHVTTRLVTQAYLDSLAADIGPDQSLLVYCTRKVRRLRTPDNIEIKRIPRDLLNKCDFEEDR